MGKIDFQLRTECRLRPISGIQQGICGEIIHRSEPFALEYAPQGLGNIEMRTIWGEDDMRDRDSYIVAKSFHTVRLVMA